MKKEIKQKAIALRREGKSYNQIVTELGVSKGTLSLWLQGIPWSRDIKRRLWSEAQDKTNKRLLKINSERAKSLRALYNEAQREAEEEFVILQKNTTFIAGLNIYWGEGDKDFLNGKVRVSNVDAGLLRVFKAFLVSVGNIEKEKIRASLVLCPDISISKATRYWSKELGIEEKYFFQPIIIQGKHPTKRSPYGVCIIQVGNKRFKKKILTWLHLFARMFES